MDQPNTQPAPTNPVAAATNASTSPHRVTKKSKSKIPWKLIIVLALLIGVGVAMFLGGHSAVEWIQGIAEKARTPETLIVLGVIYTILLAIPGVPGLEVGLVMMLVFGELGIIAVWVCTVSGLNISFYAGRKIPRAKLERWLKPKDIPDSELPAFAIGKDDTMTLVLERNKLGRKILKWTGPPGGWRRYLLIGILLNMPGNFIIGGGGGIGLFSGTSDDIKWRGYLLTVALAAAVIPLLFYFGLLTARQILPI